MMDSKTTTTKHTLPLHLNFNAEGQMVVITPEDEDRYCMTIEEAVRACNAGKHQVSFQRQFENLLVKSADWLRKNPNDISSAYLTVRDSGILFFIVRKTSGYDDAFEDTLTDFDISIAEDPNFDKIRLSVLAIPNSPQETVDSFLKPTVTVKYNAN